MIVVSYWVDEGVFGRLCKINCWRRPIIDGDRQIIFPDEESHDGFFGKVVSGRHFGCYDPETYEPTVRIVGELLGRYRSKDGW